MTDGRAAEDLVRAVHSVGISDERLLETIRTTPRAVVVPVDAAAAAYHDAPIRISHGQVTTQPSLSATMIEGLGLTGREHVLEIGTGFGFQTALLARLAATVVSIEHWPDMVRQVIVSAAFPEVPAPLVEQLRIGGHLVQPIAPGGQEEVVLFERTADGLQRRQLLTFASFVPLHGQFGFPD